jgi:hypothetical protein
MSTEQQTTGENGRETTLAGDFTLTAKLVTLPSLCHSVEEYKL